MVRFSRSHPGWRRTSRFNSVMNQGEKTVQRVAPFPPTSKHPREVACLGLQSSSAPVA
jgi:hypothetical protein